ncbi:putative zinc-binding metallopeptidase [Flammeovirga pacifica]|uniref:Uncharacterized protein n=1 Tax=Flammeovirga pacifica TaxID=915059 RepID=A0A1S1YWX1_FLAPC|nr:putative zinc-binding metallopeptidase [Flammeovirga pacifica]OHX65393.1 hypothetical protein NH26_03035 [Flammeovirga pacifica]
MKKTYFILLILYITNYTYAQNELEDEVGETVGIWEIQNGALKTNNSYNDDKGTVYWNYFTTVLPNDLINKYVVRFRLYTDGIQEDLGGFNSMDESNKHWTVEFDVADMDFSNQDPLYIQEYQHTLIHEFGHLICLNASQMQPSDDEYQDDSKGYLTSEGYAIKGSYLDKYITAFWPIDLLNKWDKIDAIKSQNRKGKKLVDFYFDHEEDFVSDYACESPEEDFAESWTFFILDDINVPTNLKEDKVIFFHQFPELVEYRKKIRAKLKILPPNYLKTYMANQD